MGTNLVIYNDKKCREKFDSLVDKTGECWLWLGGVDRSGYARFQTRVDGKIQNVLSHRYAYYIAHNEHLDKKIKITRKCNNPLCVNPEHLHVLKTEIERFWSRVDIKSENECWNWIGPRTSNNYGMFFIATNKYKIASRYSYLINYGSLPDDLQVCHKCDNPPCVNPNHLFLGTAKENMQDCINKGRKVVAPAKKGEQSPNAKLTMEQVREIRKRYNNEKISITKLAEVYKVGNTTISRIINNETYMEE